MKNTNNKKWLFVAVNFLGWKIADSPGQAIGGLDLNLGDFPDSMDYPETEEGEEALDDAQLEWFKEKEEREKDISLWIIPEGEEIQTDNYQITNGILIYNNFRIFDKPENQNLLIASNSKQGE